MPTIQSLLDDINLRYRNSYSTDQILVWMNDEQRELFEVLELDSVPFSFSTVAGQYLYPIPDGVEKDRIKVMTYQMDSAASPDYAEVPFKENDNNQYVFGDELFYTILEDNFYLNIPGGPLDDRTIYIYLDEQPEDMVSSSLNVEPSVPVRWQELLKLGTVKRIAEARKDVVMYNNYSGIYEDKLSQMMEKMALQIPEFHTPIDTLPRASRNRTGRYVKYVTLTSN